MGQRLQIEWQQTADQLKLFYQWERNPNRKVRVQALWHLRCGKRLQDVSDFIDVCYRTLQYWVAWYRAGGLTEVLRRIPGHDIRAIAKLAPIRQRALAAKLALGLSRTVWNGIQWMQDRWNIRYSYPSLHNCLKRLKGRLKMPRPRSVKADIEEQNEWKVTGLAQALHGAEMNTSHRVWFSDEMRFGLWGQTRKRGACVG
jgi:transposase